MLDVQQTDAIETEVLVIGGGLAGLRAAIEAKKQGANVLLVSKSRVGLANNSAIAGGGFAVAAGTGWRGPEDRYEDHIQDTLASGRNVNDRQMVETMVHEAASQVADLETFGVKIKKRDDAYWVVLAAGHSYPRVLLPEKAAGTSITRPMRDYAESVGVRFDEGTVITAILKNADVACGAMGVDRLGNAVVYHAGATILAAGGLGRIYLHTDNAPDATGDGYYLAYEAGLPMKDMEFVQFIPGRPTYEVFVARFGGIVRNRLGENVLEKHGMTDSRSMTRDAVSRAIWMEIAGGRSFPGEQLGLDVSSIPADRMERLQGMLQKGLPKLADNVHQMSPPSVHFFMGGAVVTDGVETAVKGLLACGEICAGVHGANRLGANALTECLVFGAESGRRAVDWVRDRARTPLDNSVANRELERLRRIASQRGDVSVAELSLELRKAMWAGAGIVRDASGLEEALKDIRRVKERLGQATAGDVRSFHGLLSLHSMVAVSDLVARAALARTESRGAHYRSDFPEEDDERWLRNTVLVKGPDDAPVLATEPVKAVEAIS